MNEQGTPMQAPWQERLQHAIELREQSQLEQSLLLLLELADEFADDGTVQYQCAWAHDALGKETAAVPYYVRALSLELTDVDRQGAYLGLGSTYRAIGEYEKSKSLLEEAITRYPEVRKFQVFYAMTLYNLGLYEQSTSLLLHQLADTSHDPSIVKYNRALRFYANHLNDVWIDE